MAALKVEGTQLATVLSYGEINFLSISINVHLISKELLGKTFYFIQSKIISSNANKFMSMTSRRKKKIKKIHNFILNHVFGVENLLHNEKLNLLRLSDMRMNLCGSMAWNVMPVMLYGEFL